MLLVGSSAHSRQEQEGVAAWLQQMESSRLYMLAMGMLSYTWLCEALSCTV
jgi:hypothetical protein